MKTAPIRKVRRPSNIYKVYNAGVWNELLGKYLTASMYDYRTIKLAYKYPSGSTAHGISIERSMDGVNFTEIATTANTSYTDRGLNSSTKYYYRIRLYRSNLFSAYSSVVSTTTADSAFIIEVNTTQAGSPSNTFRLPTIGAGYNAVINWGDGNTQTISGSPGSVSHTYSTNGIKEIKITGIFPRIYFNNTGDKAKLIKIKNWGNIKWSNMSNAFDGCRFMQGTYLDAPDFTNVTNMQRMFAGCEAFNWTTNTFNTSNVTNMSNMFNYCVLFNQEVSLWDTSKVTNMSGMFENCRQFKQTVSNFDTSNVTDMKNMFFECNAFTAGVPFNTSKVITMESMFYRCLNFNSSVSSFNTSNVVNMSSMFHNCPMFNQPVNNFDTSQVTNMYALFSGCTSFNQAVSNFNTSNVVSMHYMFFNCSSFNQSVSSFNTANAINMNTMFYGCSSFNQPVNTLNISNVENISNMFGGCIKFKQSLATFDIKNIKSVSYMLDGCDINTVDTTTNYDTTLVSWAAQDPIESIIFHGGSSKYSATGFVAREILRVRDQWSITDGGLME